jgi:hypothetical protein
MNKIRPRPPKGREGSLGKARSALGSEYGNIKVVFPDEPVVGPKLSLPQAHP